MKLLVSEYFRKPDGKIDWDMSRARYACLDCGRGEDGTEPLRWEDLKLTKMLTVVEPSAFKVFGAR